MPRNLFSRWTFSLIGSGSLSTHGIHGRRCSMLSVTDSDSKRASDGSPSAARLLSESVTESIEHLRPWMPWVDNEPEPIKEKVQRLKRFRGMFDLGQNFVYGIFNLENTKLIGGTGLHPRLGEN